jgi:hypothetical protein
MTTIKKMISDFSFNHLINNKAVEGFISNRFVYYISVNISVNCVGLTPTAPGIEINLNKWGRKSFAIQALQSIEKGMVSHLLRHQDPRMIDHYAEYQTEPLKSALDKIQILKSKDKILIN